MVNFFKRLTCEHLRGQLRDREWLCPCETILFGVHQMKHMKLFLCVMITLVCGLMVCDVYAQTGTGRALFAYPMNGQTLDQENADRAACHDWAVGQTGYDPTYVYAAQQYQYWIKPAQTGASYEHPRYPNKAVGFAGARTNADIRRLNELYAAYLRAGAVCLEARGYQVSR